MARNFSNFRSEDGGLKSEELSQTSILKNNEELNIVNEELEELINQVMSQYVG